MRKRIAIAVMSAVVIGGGWWGYAQAQQPPALPPLGTNAGSSVFSGGDLGFRVDRWEGDVPVGRWVVKVDGRWIEVRTAVGSRRLGSQ